MASRMTKDQLREALSDVGVRTQARLKKAELVRLYRENVLKQKVEMISQNDSIIGGFSSDEEEAVVALDTSHIRPDSNVASLTNDEIFYKLKELGENVGPILNSTRVIYERKLAKLLGSGDAYGDVDDGLGMFRQERNDIATFSGDEEEEELDKDETDEYENGVDIIRKNGDIDMMFDEGGQLKTSHIFHEKVEEDNGTVVRTRRAQVTKNYTMDKTNGKTFVPPQPRKINYAFIGVVALVVLLIIAALIFFNLERSQQFTAVPAAEVPQFSKPGPTPAAQAAR